jgi:membrane protease YdiL (CAAX protease family)
VLAFLAVMFSLTWLPAALLAPLWSVASDPAATRLLKASILYAAFMTFQPLVALAVVRRWFDDRPIDYGLRRAPARWQTLAVVGPLVLAGLSAGFALVIDGAERSTSAALQPALAPQFASSTGAVLLIFAFLGSVCMLWVQAMTEEIGWRGYLLPRLMQSLGPYRGLFAHGAAWGLWYAPLLLVTSGTGLSSLARCGAFVVTCSLLGVLLGWIRIAAQSVVAAATANALLTMAAALPLVLMGGAPPRTAVYLPAGWLPLALAIATILLSRHRAVIRDFTEPR